MHITKENKILSVYFLGIFIWWAIFYFTNIRETAGNYWYQFAFGLIPLLGGISGIRKSLVWGGIKSKVGRAIFFTSAGLVSWGIGQMCWSILYNIILQVEIPYPSLADVGYVTAIPLWIIGMINLSKATGAKFSLKQAKGKLLVLIIPLIFVALSYYLLITIARSGVISDLSGGYLKVFFDFAYPLGDVIILTLAVLIYGLSFDFLGGRFKLPSIILLIGFVVMFIVDFSFSYETTQELYFNGHWVDMLFPMALGLIAFGVNSFDVDSG